MHALKRLILLISLSVTFNFLNAAHAYEVINAPTIDPSKVEENIIEDTSSDINLGGMKGKDTYEGPPLEIPNLIDVIKEKKEQRDNLKQQSQPEWDKEITPEEDNSPSKTRNDKPKQSATLDADEMEYFEDRNEIEARGHVIIRTYPEKTVLSADKAIFNRNTNIIRLFDNVILDKDGTTLRGDFMSIDLNEENVLMNEPEGTMGLLTLRAQEGYAYANEIQMVNGDAKMAKDIDMLLQTKGFGYLDETLVLRDLATPELKKKRSEPLKIKTKEIIIESKNEHDTVTLKNAEIYYKKFKVASVDSAEILTDKSQTFVETNLPEAGMFRGFGTYVGWGFTTEVPFGGTLKLMPALVYDSGLGVGLMGRYTSKRNLLEAGYATSSENLIIHGNYKFNKNLYVDYGRHAYFDEWFFGRRQPGYIAQLVYDNQYAVKDLDATFRQRWSGGYVTDYAESESGSRNGTMRLRWQGELYKTLFDKRNEEQDLRMKVYAYTQAAGTVYGTGDVTGVVRFGPMLQTRVKNWGSRIMYGMAGVHGRSPLRFDEYIYGKQYITIDENIRLGKYLALGYQGTISILRDNPDKDLLTENKFYVVAGPEDVKLAFSYDTYRERAIFDVLFLVGKDTAKIKYDKLTIKDPDKAGKKTSNFENLKYYKVKVPEDI